MNQKNGFSAYLLIKWSVVCLLLAAAAWMVAVAWIPLTIAGVIYGIWWVSNHPDNR